jgi:hypothetical protein
MMMMRPLRRRRWTAISYRVFANARPRNISSLRALRRALSPEFPAAAIVDFIP